MFEVFKTNIEDSNLADQIATSFKSVFPNVHVNFDLSDSDRIFRVENHPDHISKLEELIKNTGHHCEILD